MNAPSEEQQVIIDHIKRGVNVAVDACAGSGKSTTILSAAKSLETRQFLQMTYNSMLRCEVKDKAKQLHLHNIEVHTYHSLAVKYYLPSAHTDTGIRTILYKDLEPTRTLPKWDVIVLDEAQDMTVLFFTFMLKVIRDMHRKYGNRIQLLVMGDYMQGLYEFKGADIRFLTHADQLWTDISHILATPIFEKCTLRMSYRVTNQMANFVNHVMLGEERLQACRDGAPVTYIRNTRDNIEKTVVYHIRRLIAEGESPSDFFVLGASVKGSKSDIRKMENALVECGIPCHVPLLEMDKIDERVIEGKVVFSTFHSVKGRQRKYVFIVGFDNNYMSFYARTLPKYLCPNTLYVGCTRATHGLYLMESGEHANDRPLDFLKKSHHQMKQCEYIDFKGMPRSLFYESTLSSKKGSSKVTMHYVTPTDLIKFIPEPVVEELTPVLERIFICERAETTAFDIPTMVKTKGGYHEDVSDLNGIAVPSMYYDVIGNLRGSKVLVDMIEQDIDKMKANEHVFLKDIVATLPKEYTTPEDYLYLANVYTAVKEKLYFKVKQIDRDEYGWLDEETIRQCRGRIDDALGLECILEQPEIEMCLVSADDAEHVRIDQELANYLPADAKYRFSARADLITFATIWEIKCTSKLSMDHLLQVILYTWLWRMNHRDKRGYIDAKIFNIKTGEILRLNATTEELTMVVVALLRGKYGKQEEIGDEDFVETCTKIRERWTQL